MIVKRDNFSNLSVSPHKCFVLNRGKQEEESGVFYLGDIELERGTVEISEQAVKDMALMLGWESPYAVHGLKEQIKKLQEMLEEHEDVESGYTSTIRRLSRELDVAEATKQDAIDQLRAHLQADKPAAPATKATPKK